MLPTLCLIIYKLLEEIVFPSGSESKERVYLQCGRPRLIPGLGRYPGEGNGSPLQYSCLENPIHGDFQSPNPWGHKESDMTEQLTHSLEGITTQLAIAVISTCNIIIKSNRALWFPENNKVSLLTVNLVAQTVKCLPTMWETWVGKISWRRKWQPTPILLPGKCHGWRSLVGYSSRGHKESDMTERLHFQPKA